jgi:hypothetical protein
MSESNDLSLLAVQICDVLLKKYNDRIQLVTITGSVADESFNSYSDIDIGIILEGFQEDERDSFLTNFVLDGTIINLSPGSFEELEQLAHGTELPYWPMIISVIAKSRVLYAKHFEFIKRFTSLQDEIDQEYKVPEDEKEKFLSVMMRNLIRQHQAIMENDETQMKKVLWGMLDRLFLTLARLNQSYFSGYWDRDLSIFDNFDLLPDDFESTVKAILNETDPWIQFGNSMQLIQGTLALFESSQTEIHSTQEPEVVFDNNYYVTILSKVNKLKSAMDRKNILEYDHRLTQFQRDLHTLTSHEVIGLNLRGAIQYQKMRLDSINEDLIQDRIHVLDQLMQEIRDYYERKGIEIMKFDSLEDWEGYLES